MQLFHQALSSEFLERAVPWLSRDQTVTTVDDSSNYQARFNTIINYHQLSRSLDVLKFDMIVDDSFFRLIAGMIVHDSFSVSGFARDGLNATFFPT